MEFSRQEYWSGLPFPSPGDLPDPGTEPVMSLVSLCMYCFFKAMRHPFMANRWGNSGNSVRLYFFGLQNHCLGFPGGSDSKESACNAGDLGSIPGLEDPLEEGMAIHSSILAWRIP